MEHKNELIDLNDMFGKYTKKEIIRGICNATKFDPALRKKIEQQIYEAALDNAWTDLNAKTEAAKKAAADAIRYRGELKAKYGDKLTIDILTEEEKTEIFSLLSASAAAEDEQRKAMFSYTKKSH